MIVHDRKPPSPFVGALVAMGRVLPATAGRSLGALAWAIPLLILVLVGLWSLVARPLVAAAFEQWEYREYVPGPDYEIDENRMLRWPALRPAPVVTSLERMETAKRGMLGLASSTCWGDDRTVKYLRYTAHFGRALEFALVFRYEFAELMNGLKADLLVDDPELVTHLLRLREWGTLTALVAHEPTFPRHPHERVERVLLLPRP